MSISVITKDQWVSIIKNTVFAAIAAYTASVASGSAQKAALLVGIMAGIKVVEKMFTEG